MEFVVLTFDLAFRCAAGGHSAVTVECKGRDGVARSDVDPWWSGCDGDAASTANLETLVELMRREAGR